MMTRTCDKGLGQAGSPDSSLFDCLLACLFVCLFLPSGLLVSFWQEWALPGIAPILRRERSVALATGELPRRSSMYYVPRRVDVCTGVYLDTRCVCTCCCTDTFVAGLLLARTRVQSGTVCDPPKECCQHPTQLNMYQEWANHSPYSISLDWVSQIGMINQDSADHESVPTGSPPPLPGVALGDGERCTCGMCGRDRGTRRVVSTQATATPEQGKKKKAGWSGMEFRTRARGLVGCRDWDHGDHWDTGAAPGCWVLLLGARSQVESSQS
jgi:hypothetical protein